MAIVTDAGPPSSRTTPASPTTGPATVTIGSSSDFSVALLEALGLPVTAANVGALNAWQRAEGQWTATGDWNPSANHNPLNTTEGTGAIGRHGSAGISIYPDWTTGVAATARTLQYGRYAGVLNVLRTGQASPSLLSAAVVPSGWGTGPFGGDSMASQAGTGASQTATLDVSQSDLSGRSATQGGISVIEQNVPGLKEIKSVADFLGLIVTRRFWMGALGVGFVIGGTALFIASTKPGQTAMEVAPLALAAA
jgi:hypothetical protein